MKQERRITSSLIRAILRLTPVRIIRKMTVEQRAEALEYLTRRFRSGLSESDRYLLLKRLHDRTVMWKYPLTRSDYCARIYSFFDVVGKIRDVPGDIVECGVGFGHSLAYMAYALALFKIGDKKLYGFDSFQGFPETSGSDQEPGSRISESGRQGYDNTSRRLVEEILAHEKSQTFPDLLREHDGRISLIPGFFTDTMPGMLPERIAFLHVDCDLYESTRTVLVNCLPRMSPGSLVLFDEYHAEESWPGEKKAVDEISAEVGKSVVYFPEYRRFGYSIPR